MSRTGPSTETGSGSGVARTLGGVGRGNGVAAIDHECTFGVIKMF